MIPSMMLLAAALAGPHADHMARMGADAHSVPVTPGPLPPPAGPGQARVYGYQAYWNADLAAVPWDSLTDLALFAAEAGADGSLTLTDRWDDAATAVAMAEPYGVRVHLCVIQFDSDTLDALLSSPQARTKLITNLAANVQSTGAHGVNIDFEGMPEARRADMVAFIEELTTQVPEVVIATPAVDWSDAWDVATLTDYADLFIMGYGYHWNGSTYAGPVDPLYGGDPWAQWALDWSVNDYLDEGADPTRLILGLPLYGTEWPTASASFPALSEGTGETVLMSEVAALDDAHGLRHDDASASSYVWTGAAQAWVPTVERVRERITYTLDAGFAGTGFWALHYDGGDEALWAAVREATQSNDTTPPDDTPRGGILVDAGPPFLAYAGDLVQLSAEGSTGPGELTFRWTQVGGPESTLSDANLANPTFRAGSPGTYTFDVAVAAGDEEAVGRTYLVVVDPGRGLIVCGCQSGQPVSWLPLALLGLGLVRRRRDA